MKQRKESYKKTSDIVGDEVEFTPVMLAMFKTILAT